MTKFFHLIFSIDERIFFFVQYFVRQIDKFTRLDKKKIRIIFNILFYCFHIVFVIIPFIGSVTFFVDVKNTTRIYFLLSLIWSISLIAIMISIKDIIKKKEFISELKTDSLSLPQQELLYLIKTEVMLRNIMFMIFVHLFFFFCLVIIFAETLRLVFTIHLITMIFLFLIKSYVEQDYIFDSLKTQRRKKSISNS